MPPLKTYKVYFKTNLIDTTIKAHSWSHAKTIADKYFKEWDRIYRY